MITATLARDAFAPRRPPGMGPGLALALGVHVLLIIALVDAFGLIGLVFASTVAMTIEACVARLLMTHPQATRSAHTLPELRQRIEGTRRRLLLLPEPNATQLGGLVARLGALAADADSQLR